jgi:patatin-like phospholipase/acyl hydrolase
MAVRSCDRGEQNVADFRIIALDGGGIRGVLTAVLLDRLAQAYPRLLQNQPGSKSMFAGTSTGGILALGLADGLTPAQMRDLYVVNGKSIFDAGWARNVVELGGLAGSKYDNENLKGVLQHTFGAKRLKDLSARVLIPSFSLDNGSSDPAQRTWSPKFFHNFPGADTDGDVLLVDVAMSTGAAPTYFPSYNEHIDGAVIANNPSMAAIAQVLDDRNDASDRAALSEIRLLSVGTGLTLQYIEQKNLDWGDAQWIQPILNVMMDGSVGVADFEARQLLGPRYCRVEPIFPAGCSFPLDDVSKVVDLMKFGQNFDLAPAIAWLNGVSW